ncbi:hypothetical protein OX283_008805 [Flavobacterium sp. SUN052]|uniref:hypothetical protein n=1 Tax=Flavobacterium sp. SUN052 TaxID=3002441 RepID=UPI00237E1EBE|nr:hypothetical protein [Flavobacterium sp. SUN052]MEC4004755.1 hypothetical protein [Flavobacterium sp. SUN052]
MEKEEKKFILYTAPSGEIHVDVYLQEVTIWLTQKAMAELFGVVKSTISEHLTFIFNSNELKVESIVRNFRTTEFELS